MADNLTLNSGTGGATLSTDEVTRATVVQHVQYVKLMNGTDAAVDVIPGEATNGLDVDVTRVQGTVTVDGSGVTQPVSNAGLTELAAAINASSQMDVNIAASGATVPVSNAGLTELAAAINASSQMDVNIAASGATLTVASHAVTNAGTFAVQESGAALTALQLLDNPVVVDDAAFTPATTSVMMAGFEYDDTLPDSVNEGDAGAARMSANRNVYMQIRDAAGNERGVNVNASNQMSVSVDAALPAGANAIGKLASNTGVTIGAVEIAAAQTLATVTTVSTVSTLTGGGVAHDGADSGNPIKIGAKVETSPKGITLPVDGDRTDLYADSDGMLMVKIGTSGADLLSEAVSNTDGASTAFTNFGAVASTYNYVTGYSIFRTDAGTSPIYVDFRDGTAGSVKWRVVIPPNSGANLASAIPLFKTSANTALAYDVSAATTTVYISVSGFQSKV